MGVAVLRMTSATSNQYDLKLDQFMIDVLLEKNVGYRNLFYVVKEKYNKNISFETFNDHINHLKKTGLINKDQKYSPFYLTEKCKRRLRLHALTLVPPVQILDDSSADP